MPAASFDRTSRYGSSSSAASKTGLDIPTVQGLHSDAYGHPVLDSSDLAEDSVIEDSALLSATVSLETILHSPIVPPSFPSVQVDSVHTESKEASIGEEVCGSTAALCTLDSIQCQVDKRPDEYHRKEVVLERSVASLMNFSVTKHSDKGPLKSQEVTPAIVDVSLSAFPMSCSSLSCADPIKSEPIHLLGCSIFAVDSEGDDDHPYEYDWTTLKESVALKDTEAKRSVKLIEYMHPVSALTPTVFNVEKSSPPQPSLSMTRSASVPTRARAYGQPTRSSSLKSLTNTARNKPKAGATTASPSKTGKSTVAKENVQGIKDNLRGSRPFVKAFVKRAWH